MPPRNRDAGLDEDEDDSALSDEDLIRQGLEASGESFEQDDDFSDLSDEDLIQQGLEADSASDAEPPPLVPDQQPERAWYQDLGDSVVSFGQGAGFNALDEIAAPLDYAWEWAEGKIAGKPSKYGSLGEAYDANRAFTERAVRQRPLSNLAGQVAAGAALSMLGPATVPAQALIGAGHGALMELGGDRDLTGGLMRAAGGATGGAFGGYLGSKAMTAYPKQLPGRPIPWVEDDLKMLWEAERQGLPPPPRPARPPTQPLSDLEMAQHAAHSERVLGPYHPPAPSAAPEAGPYLRGAESMMPEQAGYGTSPMRPPRPSVRDYELVPQDSPDPFVRGYMTPEEMAGGAPMRPQGARPTTLSTEMIPETPADPFARGYMTPEEMAGGMSMSPQTGRPLSLSTEMVPEEMADPIMRGRAQYEIEPRVPEPDILGRDIRRATARNEVPVEGPRIRGKQGRYLPRPMREVGGERIQPPYNGPLDLPSEPPPGLIPGEVSASRAPAGPVSPLELLAEPPPSMVPGPVSASRAPAGPVSPVDLPPPLPRDYMLQASGQSRAPTGPVEPLELPLEPRAPSRSSQPWMFDDWAEPPTSAPPPPSRRPMAEMPTEPWNEPGTRERLIQQLEGKTSLPPPVPKTGGMAYEVGRDIAGVAPAPRWARRAFGALEQHGFVPPTGRDLIERGLAMPNETAGRRMTAASMGAYNAAAGGLEQTARAEEVAYADAPAMHYALTETLASGDTGLSPEDQQALTSAVVRGDDQAIAAIDFKLRQRVPGYARRVERALRALNQEE